MISEAQREERRTGLGGSDIAGIIPCKTNPTGTLSPWATAVQIWNSKLHPEAEEREETEAMWWGSEEEGIIDRRFRLLTGKATVNHNFTIHDGCLLANLDRLIIPDGQKIAAYHGEVRTNQLAEYKTSGERWADAVEVETLPNGYKVLDGTTGVPVHYQTQAYHYLGRCPTANRLYFGVKFAIPAGRFTRTQFGVYVLQRNNEIIKAQDAFAREWWHRHIELGEKPEAVNESDCKILWARSAPATSVTITADIAAAWVRLRDAKNALAKIEEEESAAKCALQKAMGENEAIVSADKKVVLATWKSGKDKTVSSVDWEGLARSHGVTDEEIASATTTATKPGARTFLLKTTKAAEETAEGMVADAEIAAAEAETAEPAEQMPVAS